MNDPKTEKVEARYSYHNDWLSLESTGVAHYALRGYLHGKEVREDLSGVLLVDALVAFTRLVTMPKPKSKPEEAKPAKKRRIHPVAAAAVEEPPASPRAKLKHSPNASAVIDRLTAARVPWPGGRYNGTLEYLRRRSSAATREEGEYLWELKPVFADGATHPVVVSWDLSAGEVAHGAGTLVFDSVKKVWCFKK